MKRKGKGKGKGSRKETYLRYINNSALALYQIPSGYIISITGKCSVFPSTSNSKSIFRTRGTSKTFVANNSSHIARLQAVTDLFYQAVAKQGIRTSKIFTDSCVYVYLSKASNRTDSHNNSKPIGDWLESVDIIDDDRNAGIYCYRKTECGINSIDSTDIIITTIVNPERERARALYLAYKDHGQ